MMTGRTRSKLAWRLIFIAHKMRHLLTIVTTFALSLNGSHLTSIEDQIKIELKEFVRESRAGRDVVNVEEMEMPGDFSDHELVDIVSRNSSWCEELVMTNEMRRVEGKVYSKVILTDPAYISVLTNHQGGGAQGERSVRPVWNCFQQDSAILVNKVREIILEPNLKQDYNLSRPVKEILLMKQEDPDQYQDLSFEVENYFRQKKNGFFIEAGAVDGELDSHSLRLEVEHGWTGLLVEPNINDLPNKHRRAKVVETCLAIEARPHYVHFDHLSSVRDFSMAGIVTQETETSTQLQCIPLYSLLLAMANPTVHWFILDIEGAEYQVLQTIPWDKVDIEMVSVETHMAGMVMEGSREDIIEYMESKGYIHRWDIDITYLPIMINFVTGGMNLGLLKDLSME